MVQAPATLLAEIQDWLESDITPQDILDYAHALPDGNRLICMQALDFVSNILSQRKQAFFTKAGFTTFLSDLPEPIQLNYIHSFAEYSTSSVLSNIEKKYRLVPTLPVTITFGEWADDYVLTWNKAHFLGSAPEYLVRLEYVGFLIGQGLSQVQLKNILQESFRLKTALDGETDEARLYAMQEKTTFLESLGFIPKDNIAALVTEDQELRCLALIRRVQSVLGVMVQHADLVTDRSEIEVALWYQLRTEYETIRLQELEVNRLAIYSSDYSKSNELVAKLQPIWTLEGVRSGQSGILTQQLLTQYPEVDVLEMKEILIGFFASSLIAREIMYQYPIGELLAEMFADDDEESAREYMSALIEYEEDPASQQLVALFINQIYQSIKGLNAPRS